MQSQSSSRLAERRLDTGRAARAFSLRGLRDIGYENLVVRSSLATQIRCLHLGTINAWPLDSGPMSRKVKLHRRRDDESTG